MFDYSRLRRFPDVEAPNLQAWDATDELLVDWAIAAEVPGDQIAVIGDEYGAIALALSDAGIRGIRVHQDLVTGRRALANNARAMGVDGAAFTSHELDETLLAGARLVLLQLPKTLAALDEISDAIARWAAPDVQLVAGGRVKHMTLAQNDVLARHFAVVQPQRAARKSRLLLASAPARPAAPTSALPAPTLAPDAPAAPASLGEKPLPVPETTSHVVSHTADGFSRVEFTLYAYGGVFAGSKLDIGTRALLDVMPTLDGDPRVIDLGCGTGALAVAFALQHPTATVIATDRSAAAVRSARATVAANHLEDRITVTLDDAGSELPDGSADLVLLNPPFHLGASVHEGAGRRLIEAAARLVRPGGEVWTVFNSHLDHRRALAREIGPTEQVARTPKFTVTRSVRRDRIPR